MSKHSHKFKFLRPGSQREGLNNVFYCLKCKVGCWENMKAIEYFMEIDPGSTFTEVPVMRDDVIEYYMGNAFTRSVYCKWSDEEFLVKEIVE